MKQTNADEWVYIVLHSETLYYQIFADDAHQTRPKPRWVRILLRLLETGSRFYGLPIL